MMCLTQLIYFRRLAWWKCVALLIFLVLSFSSLPAFSQNKFVDPLDSPAAYRSAVAGRPLMAVTRAGERFVAVGMRGLIIVSEDAGKTWKQAKVPVQSDLLAVHFPTPTDGWAVGHDGVILHSGDGGKTWVKQLDGRVAEQLFKDYYQKAAASGDASMQTAVVQTGDIFRGGPALPFLDVWFEDSQKGFAVGSFAMFAATVDGGKTWEPWLHRIQNDKGFNLNCIRGIGANLYIAGEHGIVYRRDNSSGRFVSLNTGYTGSFFGIAGKAETLLAFGLKGVVYRSGNGGASWEALDMPAHYTINAGIYSAALDAFVLVNGVGNIMISDSEGRNFRIASEGKTPRLTGIVSVNNRSFIITGLGGVTSVTLADAGN
ncbi:MAG: YCF48-related protein [Dehalococcoidia bacterium]